MGHKRTCLCIPLVHLQKVSTVVWLGTQASTAELKMGRVFSHKFPFETHTGKRTHLDRLAPLLELIMLPGDLIKMVSPLPESFPASPPPYLVLSPFNRDIKGTRTVKPAQAGINAMASIGKQRMNVSPQVSKLSPLRSQVKSGSFSSRSSKATGLMRARCRAKPTSGPCTAVATHLCFLPPA
ncbi:unnamed protein product [Arctogadus glacialis]